MTSVPVIFDRQVLVHRRDRCAGTADVADFLLARVADDLAERIAIVNRRFEAGLVVEAYHGVVGRRLRSLANVGGTLREAEPSAGLRARIAATTPAVDPLDVGHDDLVRIVAPESLDLIVSALSLQFVDDLPGALIQCRQVLKPDGLLTAALLGGDTLRELREAWLVAEDEVSGGASPRVAPFADVRALGSLLQRAGFALPVVDSDTVTVTYATPLHLMRDLKAMAASNPLADRRRVPVTRRLLMRAAEVYTERFAGPDGRVPATFEIVTLTAWVPHASQPRPLRPGSASIRLADALGVKEVKVRDGGV